MGDGTELTEHSGVERWLSSPLRRLCIGFVCVILLAVLSAAMWADEALAFGGRIDWAYAAERRAVRLAPWALLFEPLYWSLKFASGWRRGLLLLLLVHVPLSFGVALGMAVFDSFVGEWILGPPPWSAGRGGSSVQFSGWTRFRAEDGLAAYWILIGLGFAVRSYLNNREQERRARDLVVRTARLQRDLMEAQLSNLRNQLHPHFLFNALNSLAALIRERRDDVALSTLVSLGSLLRTMVDRDTETEVSLNDELELVDRYLEIERLRLGDRLVDTTSVEADVGATQVPALCMLPLVENAIKYGIAPREEGGRLDIGVWREGDRVRIEITDDGPGFPEEVLDARRESVGLSNTRARLRALYGDEADVTLGNRAEGGARAVIWLPGRARANGREAS